MHLPKFEFSKDWKDPNNHRTVYVSIRYPRWSLIALLSNAGPGWKIPDHTDGNERSVGSIPSLWLMLQRPAQGGDLVVEGVPSGRRRIWWFDGAKSHGVLETLQGRRTVLLFQLFRVRDKVTGGRSS